MTSVRYVPRINGKPLSGVQHKYPETVLFFPAAGQTCHAYCTYCFRWAQFVGVDELKFAARQAEDARAAVTAGRDSEGKKLVLENRQAG